MILKDVMTDGGFSGLTDAECVTALDETVEISRDETSYLWGGLNIKLLENGVDSSIVATWNELIVGLPGGKMLGEMLRSGGVNLSLDIVRGPIQAAVGLNEQLDPLLSALLQIGIKTGKCWEKYGLESLPTETEIATARAEIQNESDIASLFNELLNPMQADGSTVAQIKTAIANWSV